MPAVLDIVALRSVVAVAEFGGFHRAAEALTLSQSAVSQHVRRLERTVGRPLVRKEGRISRFTPEGEALVGEARRILAAHDAALERLGVGDPRESIVLGSTDHAADELLPRVMGALGELFPGTAVRFRLDRSSRLNDAVDRGALDLAMYIGDIVDGESVSVGALPLTWYAAPGWRRPADGPIPLVVIDSPCTIRRRALQTLADHDLPATVVGEAAYLAGVLNAVRGGLGVALVAGVGDAPPEGLAPCPDLPPVTPEPLHLRVRAGSDRRLLSAAVGALEPVLGPLSRLS
ncbi:LysR family transcriptional regulator (plasmid) [Pseudonocardia sp. EC080610-09]|uniref:LysR substrate-binding domain-containing protein n=1 Tax=unclassified Pseudonocardia TaxID=2619320 RepID=UPI000705BF61|nr:MULTISPECIES: LysR substrate-binding domain-containing protein [unclassified Pseudonocardia]ALL79461.1 LysR family transcriptional regulator [Pseudonocardia sp. EC080610-09]ALL85586.1 LysR family transcriptional regulator [Pseudonocardia sp. EC080619-01]